MQIPCYFHQHLTSHWKGIESSPGEAIAVIDRSTQSSQYFGLGINSQGDRLYATGQLNYIKLY